MALNAQSKLGLKEVADVKFYALADTSHSSALFSFDTLKVTNIEVASEEASATGGQGNSELINWSYGKAITFTMENALISPETLNLWFGGKTDADGLNMIIDSTTFPENYNIVGNTYMRSYDDGKDYPFEFEIYKAKINASGTLTMQAEGDPSTFEMTIKALKTPGGSLIKFTQSSTART